MNEIFSTGEVAALLQLKPYRIVYAIVTGQIPEASHHFLGKRCFTNEDVDLIAQHFGISQQEAK